MKYCLWSWMAWTKDTAKFLVIHSTILRRRKACTSQVPFYFSSLSPSIGFKCMYCTGVLEHGFGVVYYTNFQNIPKGANLSIHCFLTQLNKWRERHACNPKEIYLQVDGGSESANNVVHFFKLTAITFAGSENANKSLLAMCELLVQKGFCETLVMTRLPTGHTHCDVDGTFGHLWVTMQPW